MRRRTLFSRGGDDLEGGLEQAYGEGSGGPHPVGRRPILAGVAALAAGGILTGLTAAQRQSSRNQPEPSVAHGTDGAVSTPDPIATEVGTQVLEQGGNAVDAAVAIQLTLCVTKPDATGLGGGGFMVVYDAERAEPYAIDGQVQAPSSAASDRFDDVGSDVTESGLSVGVPGTPRMLDVALDRWGSASLPELIAPAISLAEGIPDVDADLERTIDGNADRLSPEAEAIFSGLSEDDSLLQEDLSETLYWLSDEGLGAFYEGAIADDIAATVQDHGGDLTEADLAGYEATADDPIVGRVNDCPCITAQPPSSGITVIQALKLLETLGAGELDRRSTDRYHALLEATRLAYADNWAHLGDASVVDVPTEGLLDELYLSRRADGIESDVANRAVEAGDPWTFQDGSGDPSGEGDHLPREGGTTHFSVADSDGNVVSCSSTLSMPFGSGIVVPGRGIVLSNSLTNFEFSSDGPNSVAANKRPVSTLSPMIVLDDGEPILALGGSGGATIPSVVTQILQGVLAHGVDPATAIAEPRVFSGASTSVRWESTLPEDSRRGLDELGYETDDEPSDIGAIQALSIGEEYVGIADARGTGEAQAIPREE